MEFSFLWNSLDQSEIDGHSIWCGERDGLSVHEEAEWRWHQVNTHRGKNCQGGGHAGGKEAFQVHSTPLSLLKSISSQSINIFFHVLML